MAEVTLQPEMPEYAALREALDAGGPITITTVEPWTEKVFAKGDRVRVPFDSGMGPATIDRISTSYGETFVYVRYGPGGKYTTSLSPHSVRTDNVIVHPATIVIGPA